MTPAEAETFIAERHNGVIITLMRSDGRPQASMVAYALIDGRVRISVTDSRVKTANLRNDPRLTLFVPGDNVWTYVVAEGTAELSPISTEPGDATGRALLELYEAIAGQHPDHDEFLRAMVDDRRLQISFAIDHLYPVER